MWTVVAVTPSVAAANTDGIWLTSTLVGLLAVLVLGFVAAGYMYAARRFRWLTHAEQLRLSRAFRVAFGGLFLAAALLPYLLVKAPLLAIASMSLALLALIPILLTRPETEVPSADDTLKPES